MANEYINTSSYNNFLNEINVLKTQFKGIKNSMINLYPDYKLTSDKKGFKDEISHLEKFLENVRSLENRIKSATQNNYNNMKASERIIRLNKYKLDSIENDLKNNVKMNNSGSVLKTDKYNKNIEEYLKSYFFVFTILLMGGFIYNKVKN